MSVQAICSTTASEHMRSESAAAYLNKTMQNYNADYQLSKQNCTFTHGVHGEPDFNRTQIFNAEFGDLTNQNNQS